MERKTDAEIRIMIDNSLDEIAKRLMNDTQYLSAELGYRLAETPLLAEIVKLNRIIVQWMNTKNDDDKQISDKDKKIAELEFALTDPATLHTHLLKSNILNEGHYLHLLGDEYQNMAAKIEELKSAIRALLNNPENLINDMQRTTIEDKL